MDLKWLLVIVGNIVSAILEAVSPQLRELLIDLVEKVEEAASETTNKFDDELVNVLKVILGLP